MKCPVCKGKKHYYDIVETYNAVWSPRPCPNGNCINGRHMVPRDPKRDHIGYGSNMLVHGMEGKALCPHCIGKGCNSCMGTGMFGIPCRKCGASGWVWHRENYKINSETGEKKVCLYCSDGQYSRGGNFGEILQEAFGTAICQTKNLENKEDEQ